MREGDQVTDFTGIGPLKRGDVAGPHRPPGGQVRDAAPGERCSSSSDSK
jgi:hypothetical protein